MSENVPCIFELIDEETNRGWSGCKTKKIAERAQVLSGKFRIKPTSEAGKKSRIVAYNNDVINIKK